MTFYATSGYVKDVVSPAAFIPPKTQANWYTKNWHQVWWGATYGWPVKFDPFSHDKIALLAERCKKLLSAWSDMLPAGYFDAASQALYVRRTHVKLTYDPYYSFVLHGTKMFLVLKGNKSERLAEGKTTRFAYGYDITNGHAHYVVGTMKLKEALTAEQCEKVAREQFEAHRNLPNMPEKCDLVCTFTAPSKDGTMKKLYMIFSRPMDWSKLLDSIK